MWRCTIENGIHTMMIFISSQEKLLAITGKPDPAAVENMLSKQLVSYGAWWWYVQPTVIWARSRNFPSFIFDVFIKYVIVCLSVFLF